MLCPKETVQYICLCYECMYMLNTNSNINDSTTNSPDNGADGVQFSVLAASVFHGYSGLIII